MVEFMKSLNGAEKRIEIASHMIYVIFPLIKDKRILIKVILELNFSVVECINLILQYEYLFKRIFLHKDKKINFEIFKEKCAKRYNITEDEISKIILLFKLVKKHKNNFSEFIKEDKLIILSENFNKEVLTIEKIKEFIELSRIILDKTRQIFSKYNYEN